MSLNGSGLKSRESGRGREKRPSFHPSFLLNRSTRNGDLTKGPKTNAAGPIGGRRTRRRTRNEIPQTAEAENERENR